MGKAKTLVFFAFIALASCNEVEDVEQKKRDAAKTSNLNAIPTGAQKPEYTYSIYTPNPNQQPGPTYSQNQVPNSFYPSQSGAISQYYSSPNSPDHQSSYPPQPQLNLIPPPSSSQFVPFNYVPNPGYQTKFQVIPSKSHNGNFQLAIIPQQPSFSQGIVPFTQSLFSAGPQQIHPQQQIPAQSNFNIGSNFQPFPLTQPYIGHPSSMFLLTPPSASLYNNYVLPNPSQQLYNYVQSSPQAKYNHIYNASPPSNAVTHSTDYEKYQASPSQPVSKDDNEISVQTNDYITPAESNANYKSGYTTGHGSSYKS